MNPKFPETYSHPCQVHEQRKLFMLRLFYRLFKRSLEKLTPDSSSNSDPDWVTVAIAKVFAKNFTTDMMDLFRVELDRSY